MDVSLQEATFHCACKCRALQDHALRVNLIKMHEEKKRKRDYSSEILHVAVVGSSVIEGVGGRKDKKHTLLFLLLPPGAPLLSLPITAFKIFPLGRHAAICMYETLYESWGSDWKLPQTICSVLLKSREEAGVFTALRGEMQHQSNTIAPHSKFTRHNPDFFSLLLPPASAGGSGERTTHLNTDPCFLPIPSCCMLPHAFSLPRLLTFCTSSWADMLQALNKHVFIYSLSYWQKTACHILYLSFPFSLGVSFGIRWEKCLAKLNGKTPRLYCSKNVTETCKTQNSKSDRQCTMSKSYSLLPSGQRLHHFHVLRICSPIQSVYC